MRRRALLALLFCLLASCGGIPVIPVTPVDPGPAPGPGPVDPGPGPAPTPAVGAISEEQYAAVVEGVSEGVLVGALGVPFRRSTVTDYTILVYAFAGTDHVAWFWIRDGKLERKSRL